MKLEIVTPMGKIFEGEIKEAVFPGSEGEFGVLDGHAPLVTTLSPGTITIKKDATEEVVAVNWGYVEVHPDRVNVLVDDAVHVAGNGVDIAEAVTKAKELLREATEATHILASAEAKIENAAKSF